MRVRYVYEFLSRRRLLALVIAVSLSAVTVTAAGLQGEAQEPRVDELRVTYLYLGGNEALQQLPQGPVLLRRVSTPEDVRRQVFDPSIAGVIFDREQLERAPRDLAQQLYASGKVIVGINMEHNELLSCAVTPAAFVDVGSENVPAATLNPGQPTGSWAAPFYSVIHRSRPGTGGYLLGETTRSFADGPGLFGALLTRAALASQELITDEHGNIRSSREARWTD